jgi:DNA-directed RNA polymerase
MGSYFDYNASLVVNKNLKATNKKLFEEVYKYYQMIINYQIIYKFICENKSDRDFSQQVNRWENEVSYKSTLVIIDLKEENENLLDTRSKLEYAVIIFKLLIDEYKVIYDIFINEFQYKLNEKDLTFEFQKN